MKTHLISKVPSLSKSQKETLIELFKLKPHIEKSVYIDWSRYETLTWTDFQEALSYRSTTELKREVSRKGIEGIRKGSDYMIVDLAIDDPHLIGAYIPLTYAISKVMASKSIGGSVGAWCTAYQKTKNYWIDYLIRGEDVLIYVIYKETKYAITVYPGNNHIDIHNAQDKEVESMEGVDKKVLLATIRRAENSSIIDWSRNFILTSIPQIERDGGFIGEEYTTNSDGSVNVYGAVNVSGRSYTAFPVTYRYVQGNFICSNNSLTTLLGAPSKVDGDFICRKNKLTSLSGAPAVIQGNFDCSDNNLNTLEGAPERINRVFSCRNNSLTSLSGAPHFIAEDLDASQNMLGESLSTIRDMVTVGKNIYV